MPVDVRLIAILDPRLLGDRDPVAAALAAAQGGATMLQVRAKDGGSGPLLALVTRLVAELPIPVWVNDRADIAWVAGAAGVHLGQDDLPADRVRALSPPGFGIGISVGNEAEAQAARGMPVDYWSIGSIYQTSNKPDAGAPIGVAGFRRLQALAPAGMPVVAIGGINADNAKEIRNAGADGIAVIGAVFGAPDIAAATRNLVSRLSSPVSHLPSPVSRPTAP
ncbi:MAG: thiamine phosphate synthase [Gemmatimonadales bacterium]